MSVFQEKEDPIISQLTHGDVLDFWFGGNQRENYRDKWFPGNGQRQVSIDLEIYTRFNHLLVAALAGELESWKDSTESILALIVVLDQFSRHIYRYLGFDSNSKDRLNADTMALSLSQLIAKPPSTLLNDNDESSVLYSMSTAKFIFSLMPFRHSATVANLEFVLKIMETYTSCCIDPDPWDAELVSRFQKQTLRRLQHLQDRKSAAEAESILAFEYADVGEELVDAMMKNQLVLSVLKFLKTYNDAGATVAISLSGGVDSMVIAKILQLLSHDENNKGILGSVIAIHIDYANREESADEADYVEWFCKKIGIQFIKRIVDEVTRGVTDRSEYERISRDIRYNFYKEVLAQYSCKGVIFGHHQGDVQENVLSNIMRGSSCLSLSGMEMIGSTNGVHVWRPLLIHSKEQIYDFAHMYGVPYFRDTTPTWSTRGKLRNHLIPLLVDMYGLGCLNNLSSLAQESDSSRTMVEKTIYAPLWDTVVRDKCGLNVNILPFLDQPRCFWREILKRLMHSLGMSMVRDKSVVGFVERIQGKGTNKKFSGWLELRKNFSVHLSESGDLTIFQDDVLLSKLANGYLIDVNSIPSSKNSVSTDTANELNLSFDPWSVRLSWSIDGTAKTNADDNMRILQSPRDLLFGKFDYYLKVPNGCLSLELLGERSGGRRTGGGKPPQQLIGIDTRIRNGLPLFTLKKSLLNNSEKAQNDTKSTEIESGYRLLHLSYQYKNI